MSKTIFLSLVVLLLVTDFWRLAKPVVHNDSSVALHVATPGIQDYSRWFARNSHDAITNWAYDMIGRTSVVELLCDHIL